MLIAIEGVSKSFGGVSAVNNVSLSIDSKQIVSLIGPNGAGKTTLFNLISGIYKPDSGTISFQGEQIQGKAQHDVARMGVSRTFQNIRLFRGMNVKENVMTALDAVNDYSLASAMLTLPSRRRIEHENRLRVAGALKIVGLENYGEHNPTDLAYGLQRRVELARAIVSEPKLLMLDEPAAGLNPSEVTDFIKLIEDLRSKFSFGIFVIEHRMQVVNDLSEKIFVINFGKMIAEGTPKEIRDNPDVVNAYLGEANESA